MEEDWRLLFQRIWFYQHWWRKRSSHYSYQDMARKVVNIEQKQRDRLMKIETEAKPRNLMIAQVYIQTTDSDDEEMKQMYKKIENIIK